MKQLLLLSIVYMSVLSELAIPQNFVLRTHAAGLGMVHSTNGVAIADYDRDGDLDIYIVVHTSYKANDSGTWNRLFSNQGDGTFSIVTTTPGLAGRDSSSLSSSSMGYKMGASWGDYDSDGWPDLFLTHLGPNQLFHNNGDGTFTEVTKQVGVAGGKTQLSSSAIWFDYDNDGDLDLYVSNWQDYNIGNRDKSNWLYENTGDGNFINVSHVSGLDDEEPTWTSVTIDANTDGLPDLYLANDFGPNKLYLNIGDKTFQDKTAEYGLEDIYHGMGLSIADCDRNGYFDIYLTNITEIGFAQEINPLFLNTGQNHFVNSSVTVGVSLAGWGWGNEFFDLENDGDEDLFVVNGYYNYVFPNVLFRNNSESNVLHFENYSHQLGLADSAEARCLTIFDYDNDGDSDLLISNFVDVPSLYENRLSQGNWLKIKLEGTASNRDAIGTVVEVKAGGRIYKKFHHGAQFLGQSIQPLIFGLNNAQTIERISVNWPSGHTDEFETIEINQTITIRENEGLITSVQQSLTGNQVSLKAVRLIGNYPNPFNGSTQIRFEINKPAEVEIEIYNLLGQTVKELHEFFPGSGEKSIRWNATDWKSQSVSSGLYLYRITLNGNKSSHKSGKMLYLK